MSPDLGSALVKAHLALGRDPIEAYRRTDETLLKLHQEEMKRIDEHYEKMKNILEGRKIPKYEISLILICIAMCIAIIIVIVLSSI
jgi:hypothetical protein